MTKQCLVTGCVGRVHDSGYCARHAQKWRKYGDPLAGRTNASAGSGHVMPNGYLRRMENRQEQLEHIRVAERALGKPLPHGAVVHHIDENRLNNDPTNLVICQDSRYHKLLHRRAEALNACGHAHWRKCRFCKLHDDPSNLFISSTNVHHRECMNAYYRAQRKEKEA